MKDCNNKNNSCLPYFPARGLPTVFEDEIDYYTIASKTYCKAETADNKADTAIDTANKAVADGEELKSYVDNYFNNLDLTGEVSDKIEDMKASGELEAILSPRGLEGKEVHFFGDSIMAGATTGGISQDNIPNNFAKLTGATVYNHAVGGASFCAWQTNTIRQQVTKADLSNADIIVLQGGINDYNRTNVVVGGVRQDLPANQSFTYAVNQTISAIKAKNSNALFIILSMFPSGSYLNHETRGNLREFQTYNERLYYLADYNGIHILNMTDFLINETNYQHYMSDNLHFTTAYYRICALRLYINLYENEVHARGQNLLKDMLVSDPSSALFTYDNGITLTLTGKSVYTSAPLTLYEGYYKLTFDVYNADSATNVVNCLIYDEVGGTGTSIFQEQYTPTGVTHFELMFWNELKQEGYLRFITSNPGSRIALQNLTLEFVDYIKSFNYERAVYPDTLAPYRSHTTYTLSLNTTNLETSSSSFQIIAYPRAGDNTYSLRARCLFKQIAPSGLDVITVNSRTYIKLAVNSVNILQFPDTASVYSIGITMLSYESTNGTLDTVSCPVVCVYDPTNTTWDFCIQFNTANTAYLRDVGFTIQYYQIV